MPSDGMRADDPSGPIARLDAASSDEAASTLMRCCGSTRWAKGMVAARPFRTAERLFEAAESAWSKTGPEDWREAFSHHPRIGDMDRLRERFARTADWSTQEQGGLSGASDEVLRTLADANREYEARFGFIFLICATGKTAQQFLEALRARLHHAPDEELKIAAAEQAKITRIRLEKLVSP